MVTDAQVKRLRKKLMEGKTMEAAAMVAGMSERSARTWKTGALPSQTKEARDWRTRPDPFAEVWTSDVVPLLEADEKGILEAKTVIDVLAEKHAGKYGESQTRTLQRRMREWRALEGPPKEVYFEQRHEPGRQGSFDFTHGTELAVTILGQAFKHLVFEFVLAFSGWTWVMLAFGETFEALVLGIQGAFWELGGVPEELRHDNLSAATHELARTGGRALTRRFADVLAHYGTRSSRITPGKGNENGVSEKAHHLLKSLVEQALMNDTPSRWRRARLGKVANLFNGKVGGTGGTWLRVFKTRHVYDGFVRLTDPTFVPDERAPAAPAATFLRSGDTLTPNMAHGTIGRVAFVRDAGETWTVDGQVMVVRPKDSSLLGRFIFDWMSRPESKRLLVNMEKGGAFDELRGQTHIYRDDVAGIPILVPPISEQRKIAAILSSVDNFFPFSSRSSAPPKW